jgi:hypothetical protein
MLIVGLKFVVVSNSLMEGLCEMEKIKYGYTDLT